MDEVNTNRNDAYNHVGIHNVEDEIIYETVETDLDLVSLYIVSLQKNEEDLNPAAGEEVPVKLKV